MRAAVDHQAFVGLSIAGAARVLGLNRYAALGWLNRHGYHVREGRVKKADLPQDVERRIAERVAAAPPARHCEHRPRSVAA